MFAYRSCGRLPCSFPGTSDLWSQIVKPHLNSSNDFSPLVISFQHFSFLCTSSWLSSTLFFISLSLSPLSSSQRLWTRVDSPHRSSTCLFSSQPSRSDTVANFLVQASWIAFPFDHGFQHSIVIDCVIILVSCTIIQSYWTVDSYLWVQRSSMLGPQHLSRARGSSSTRLWVLLPERPSEEGHASSTAARATGVQRGVANAAQPSALLPCFFLLHFHNVTIRNFHAAIVTLRWMTLSCKTQ